MIRIIAEGSAYVMFRLLSKSKRVQAMTLGSNTPASRAKERNDQQKSLLVVSKQSLRTMVYSVCQIW
jgi:hypothetical protein